MMSVKRLEVSLHEKTVFLGAVPLFLFATLGQLMCVQVVITC